MINCNMCGGNTVFVAAGIVRCEYCGKLYSNTNGELSAADPARLYSSAVNMAKSNNENSLKSAIETLEALGSYKDSFALANTYRGMIAQSRVEAEERRLEAERQAELEQIESEKRIFEAKQKAKIRGIVIAAVSAVAVVVTGMIVIYNSNKAASYNKALELYNAGQYEDAVETFGKLGDYSDSASYVSTINDFLKERDSKYEKGIGYYEKAAYSECITTLTEISEYLDSADYIDKSVEAIYQQATEKFDAGELEKARELLGKIPEGSGKHMDAELLLANIEEIIIEQTNAANYEQAKAYFDSGDYASAQRLFISLGNYEDSDNYRFAIGNIYYDQANNLFNQREYVKCGDVLQYVDTAEEWSEYVRSIELIQSTAALYQESIAKEAKKICRKEGYSAMTSYIDNSTCCVLDRDAAARLKSECNINIICLQETTPLIGESKYIWHSGGKDNMGNSYKYKVQSYVDGGYEITYALDSKYTYLSGDLALSADNSNISHEIWVEFYGDGRKIGESTRFTAGTRADNFEIDVTGVDNLKIVAIRNGSHWNNGRLLVTNGFNVSE